MASTDDFVHIWNGPESPHPAPHLGRPTVAQEYFKNSGGAREFTEGFIVDVLRKNHPGLSITTSIAYSCDLLGFANSRDDVQYFPRGEDDQSLFERQFVPSSRRYGGSSTGAIAQNVVFASYDYVFEEINFLVYIVEGNDGPYKTKYNYILIDPLDDKVAAQRKVDKLLEAGSRYEPQSYSLGNQWLIDNQDGCKNSITRF